MFGFDSSRSGSWGDDFGLAPKTFADYDALIQAGLPSCERDRMADAYENLRYADGHFDDVEAVRNGRNLINTSERWDPVRPSADDTKYEKTDFTLSQPVMKRIVGKLSENLYKRSPTRSLADKKVSAIVNDVYKRQSVGAKWQRLDHFTVVGGAGAFQFAGSDDPRCPVRIHLWSADQLCVFTDPTDHERVEAVATLDKVDGRTRLTLWTEETVAYYSTRRESNIGGSERKYELLSKTDNPYRDPDGRGIIPFSFAHFCYPATEFTWDSPGNNLRELNRYINFGFDDLADGIRYLTKPIGVAEGVDPSWEAPAIVRPGMFLNLPPGAVDAGGNGPAPKLGYLQADNSFVPTIWNHLNNFLDLSMELEGVPPSAVRMVLDARSGVSILAEQAPLLGWTEHRRRPFADYERRAVVTLLRVLAAHLRNHGRDARRLDASAHDPGLSLLWPRLYTDLPGPERDRADGTRLQWGHASLIDLIEEREDLTREQAVDKLKRVKADADMLLALGIPPVPPVLQVNHGGQAPGQAPPPGVGPGPAAPKPKRNAAAPRGPGITGEPVDANARADALSGEGG